MRKIILYLLAIVLFMATLFFACKKDNNPVKYVRLTPTEINLSPGKTATLTATVIPENATDRTVTWESSNTNVATVNNGIVTAKNTGTAVITVKTQDGSKTASCTVIVDYFAAGVTLNKEQLTLKVGDTEQLTATVLPEDATDKTVR
jgi:uncharacterized protein YjdB